MHGSALGSILLVVSSHRTTCEGMSGTPSKNRSSSPPRPQGDGEPWRGEAAAAAAKAARRRRTPQAWSLRSHFNSFVAVFFVLFVVLAVSVTTKNGERRPAAAGGGEAAVGECDLSSGRWVYDEAAYPLYKEGACGFMSDQTACEKFGRRDLRYQHWRWQPHACNLPRFDAIKLLEKLHSKRLAFVGDSLNRNQWVSMVCLLDTATPGSHKTMHSNGSLMSFKIHDYNASIDFYWSPLLVESNSDHPVRHKMPDRIVRASSIGKHARHWTDSDILVFNSYLWWRRPNITVLWGSFEGDDAVYKTIDSLRAYELAIKTWSDWLEFHVDRRRTKLFFMTMSPTHLQADEWGEDSGKKCYNETEPITREGHRGRESKPQMMQAVQEQVQRLGGRGVRVQMLNITQMSEYRKDAHPSVHRKQWEDLTQEQLLSPSSYADCIHWCLPGVPDVWNQLLYASIVS